MGKGFYSSSEQGFSCHLTNSLTPRRQFHFSTQQKNELREFTQLLTRCLIFNPLK